MQAYPWGKSHLVFCYTVYITPSDLQSQTLFDHSAPHWVWKGGPTEFLRSLLLFPQMVALQRSLLETLRSVKTNALRTYQRLAAQCHRLSCSHYFFCELSPFQTHTVFGEQRSWEKTFRVAKNHDFYMFLGRSSWSPPCSLFSEEIIWWAYPRNVSQMCSSTFFTKDYRYFPKEAFKERRKTE